MFVTLYYWNLLCGRGPHVGQPCDKKFKIFIPVKVELCCDTCSTLRCFKGICFPLLLATLKITPPMVKVVGLVRYPPQLQTTCLVYICMSFSCLAIGLQREYVCTLKHCMYCFSPPSLYLLSLLSSPLVNINLTHYRQYIYQCIYGFIPV
jgi:hypothetical protein